MAELLVVHNPKSRRGRRFVGKVRGWLESKGRIGGVVFHPIGDLDSAELPDSRVVALGGDGTVNAVLSWLHRRDASRIVGIVPAGTGNNLAGGLGIPLATVPACEVAFTSDATRSIDAISYRGEDDDSTRLIVQSGSLGFPAEITEQYDRLRRNRAFRMVATPAGTLIYKILAFLGLNAQRKRERRGEMLKMTCRFPSKDGDKTIVVDDKIIAVFIHNEPTVGGGFVPCPSARVDDGLVDLCILKAGTGVPYLKLFKEVGKGEHIKMTDTVVYEQTRGPVTLEFSAPSPFVSDGDIWLSERRYEIEMHAQRFALAVPPSRPGASAEKSGESAASAPD